MRQADEQVDGPFGESVLGEVEEDIVQAKREPFESCRVIGEEIPHMGVLDLFVVLRQGEPGC